MRTVQDIMQTDVITVRAGTPVRDLVQLLDEEGISGVPVQDPTGRVAGVVSRTDVLRMAAREREIPLADAFWEGLVMVREDLDEDDRDAFFLAPESPAVILSGERSLVGMAPDDTPVDDIMTPVAFHVDPGMDMGELARFLVSGRIHRALVMDDGRLVGIVTAFDVLRAVAENGVA